MYKDKDKQREYAREAMRKHRQGITSGITEGQGITPSPTSEGVTPKKGVTYPAIVDMLTDRTKRAKLEKIVQAFKESHHPEYAADVYVGVYGPTVLEAGALLDCTQDVPLPA